MFLVAAMAAMCARADTWKDPDTGYTWYYQINGGMAEIHDDDGWPAIWPKPTGAITIPSTLGGKPVTSIGDYAFKHCDNLTSVTIPDSVTSIGYRAFVQCYGLTSVTIPDNVTSIGEDAFVLCKGLTSVTIGNGVTSIGAAAFKMCSGLTSVTIPDSVTSIGEYAFEECSGLTSVTIGNGVTSIGDHAFGSCDELRAVHISDLAAWLRISFSGNRSNPVNLAGHLYLNGKEVTDVVVPDGITSIGYSAFDGLSSLTSVTIPDSVTNIGSYAFFDCGLKSLLVPASVKSIGWGAFAECGKLQNLTLPTWCKKIKVYYDSRTRECTLTNKTVNKKDWYPVNFLFYVFEYDDYYEKEELLNYKKLVAQATRGMKITYKDVKGGSGGGAVPEAWQKARTLKGKATCALPPPYNLRGAFELKCGKASKQGVAKVSATLTGIDGKKTSYKAQSVDVTGKTATVNLDGLSVTIDGDSFSGSDGLAGGLGVSTADVGGDWTRDGAKVYVDATGLPAGTIAELLPDGEPAIPKGGKWAFNKAATVKFSKDKTKAEWDTSKGKTNLSGLKLTYTPKTGVFKGTFKLYALEGAATARKLKKYTVNVTGVVVDGKGVGQAVIKKSAADPWAVIVE